MRTKTVLIHKHQLYGSDVLEYLTMQVVQTINQYYINGHLLTELVEAECMLISISNGLHCR